MAKSTTLIALNTWSNGVPVRDDGAGSGDTVALGVAATVETIHAKILILAGFAIGAGVTLDVGQVQLAGASFNDPLTTKWAGQSNPATNADQTLVGSSNGYNLNGDGSAGLIDTALPLENVTVNKGGALELGDVLNTGTGAAAGGSYTPPDNDGYSDAAPVYGPGLSYTGGLSAAKIMDATYGTLNPDYVLGIGGGNYIQPDADFYASNGPAYGPSGTYGGNLDMSLYVLISSVVNAAFVETGNDNYVGGDAGSYPTTANTQAAQRTIDRNALDASKILDTYNYGTAIGAASASGTFPLADYVLIADVVSASLVAAGTFNYAGGIIGTYPLTATTNASARAAVNAQVAGIIRQADGGPTITIGGVNCNNGTFNLAADDAAHVLTGRTLQLADDTQTLVDNRSEMLTTNAGIQLVFGSTTKGTAQRGLRSFGR